jgi:type I restriction enzyme R subunit
MTAGSEIPRYPQSVPGYGGFSEDAAVEGPAIELFQSLGWGHANLYQEFSRESPEGRRTMREAVLPNRLWAALQRLNPHLSPEALNEAAAEITRDRSAMLPTDANAEIYRLLKDGIPVHVRGEDGEQKTETARVIDWRDPSANNFLLGQQVWFQGELYKRRADLVGFVNGLPLLFIELKGPGENVRDAFHNNIRSYRTDVPRVFAYNAVVIVSNGIETKVGATHAPYEHFVDWKKAISEDELPAAGLEIAIRGVGAPARFLDLVENFVAYENGKGGLTKKLAKNHQFLGVNRAVAAVDRIADTRGKLGVFWHTQGSGKSLSMLYFAQKILRTKPGNWTFVIVTDRMELDRQISDTFANCSALTKERDEIQAQSREHLKQLLQGNERYVFTLIQKFGTAAGETFPKLSDRSDIIVITDEAHRSQYAVLAANMRRSLPNAAFIAFTGTPLIATDAEKTKEVFGDYVSIYDFAQSIEDGATVPLYYENRIPELQLANDDLSDDLDRMIEEAELDEAQEARLAQVFSRQYHLITRDDRLDKIADDVVRHFAGRGYRGKAMYIAIDKATALRMYDKVQTRWNAEIRRLEKEAARLSGEEKAAQEAKIAWMKATDMAVIVSAGQNEQSDMAGNGLDITPHRRRMNDEDMETKFKDPDDPFRVVFLCAMWLTGFDAPSCSTIYLDKPMKNHTLMQTIARANRVCGDKEAGLIVDYVGVFRNLQRALAIYARGTASGELPIKDKASLFGQLDKALKAVIEFADHRGVTPAAIIGAKGLARLKAIEDATEALIGTDAEKQAYLRLEGQAWKLYKAALPDQRAVSFTANMAVFHVLADRLRALTVKPDVSGVMAEIETLLDESIIGHAIRAPVRDADDMTGLFDLSAIDFDKLSAAFQKGRKKSLAQRVRAQVEQKLTEMVRQNPTRADLLEKFQSMIAEYNAGSASVEQLFEQLLEFIRRMSTEEQRAAREGMNEEELAIFDLLTKPEPALTKAQEVEVKRIARQLLAKLKHEKLILDWRLKENAKADVRQTIREEYDGLPEVYDRRIWEDKVERTFQFVFERYLGDALRNGDVAAS